MAGGGVRDGVGYSYEHALAKSGFTRVAGVDEAGRGACAGPLVAAAVVLPERPIAGLNDSKKLTPKSRERLYDVIVEQAVSWSVVSIPPGECDASGMHLANIEALRRAVMTLDVRPDFVLFDAFEVDALGIPNRSIIKGDAVSASIAAASIIAKVTRDQTMLAHHEEYPEYGFAGHKVRDRRPPEGAGRARAVRHPPAAVLERCGSG